VLVGSSKKARMAGRGIGSSGLVLAII